ncbi:MAG: 4Fe-4S binding protein [Candidatus Hodarchaeales archaeon]|jgi:polyferredoxin
MLLQFESLPTDSPAPMILFWIIVFIISYGLIDSNSMNKKRRILLYFTTIFFAGVILGGIPNVVLPIEYATDAISNKEDLIGVFHPLAIFYMITGFSLVVGRIFCGFACPLGALQELISLINFPSDVTEYQKKKFHIEVSSYTRTRIRWLFLGILLVTSLLGISFFSKINPMSGFLFTIGLSLFSMFIIIALSFFLYRPWCRFLCPFGAGSGLCSRFATIKYRRTSACTDCGKCEIVCPTQEAGTDSKKGECYFCNRCLHVCPHDAIHYDLEI